MKRIQTQHIGDVLREAIQDSTLDDGLMRAKAIRAWTLIIGDAIASQCGKPYFKDDTLTIRIPSAALRNELNMRRTQLAHNINQHIGAADDPVVKQIRFTA